MRVLYTVCMLIGANIVDSFYVNWCVKCELFLCKLVSVLWTVCILIGACTVDCLYVNWCVYCGLFVC